MFKKSIALCLLAFFLIPFMVSGQVTSEGKTYLTAKDLKKFNKDSKSGFYVAVDGVVYNVSDVPVWKSGKHKSGNAGEDLSKKIKFAPHGKKVLDKLPVAGYLVEEFTLKDLEKYNGKNKMPKYIAVDGIVYDVGDSGAWASGMHKGGTAGTDISGKITDAQHGKSVLKKRNVVGLITG